MNRRPTSLLENWNTFFGEFRRNFETTGSVIPSSRFLARTIVQHPRAAQRPARFLEAGPGTGPFTDVFIDLLQPGDRLLLVELNDRFVDILQRRLESDPAWSAKRSQVEILHGSAEDLPESFRFHAIVCGLPFANFDPQLVDRLFQIFLDRLEPEGTFSFFEYMWLRSLKSAFVGSSERQRLASVGRTIGRFFEQYRVGYDRVLLNFPPAMVHHLRKPAAV